MRYRRSIFRLMAIALILVSVSFSLPDAHFYSATKTFVKTPPPQSEFGSVIVNDVEDTDDATPDLLNIDYIKFDFSFFTTPSSETNFALHAKVVKMDPIYLIHRKLLI